MASQFPGDRPPPYTPPPHTPPPYNPPPGSGGFVGRITGILTRPAQEWQVIDAEPDTAQSVFMKWAVPLAAIGPVAGFLSSLVFGFHTGGFVIIALVLAVLQYAAALGLTWALALIVDAFAPSFNSPKNINQSMKLAAYSLTPGWLAGIFGLIPGLGFLLGILGTLYGIFLFWVGLPILKKTPADKAPTYAIVCIIADIGLYIILFFVTAAIAGAIALSMITTSSPYAGRYGSLQPGVSAPHTEVTFPA